MTINIKSFLAALVLIGTAAPASAAVVYDTSLTDPPGVYFGSGNSNSHFTVDRTGSVEIGLSAIQRFIGPITPTGSTYNVNTGPTSVPGKTGSDWGFVFSVNLNYNNDPTSPYNLANITTRLTLNDVGQGTTGSFDPRIIPDNAIFGTTGFQNAETLSFLGIRTLLGDPNYDVNADDTYIFTLEVLNGLTVLASDRITVIAGAGATAVPEPLTLSLLASGLAGIGVMRRRKKATQA